MRVTLVDAMALRSFRSEDELQMHVAQILRRFAPEDLWWTAVNPKPAKSRSVATMSKAMGLRAGAPDLVLCWHGQFLGVELKNSKGTLSDVQLEEHQRMERAGMALVTVKTLAEMVAWLQDRGVPFRQEWTPPTPTG